MFWYLQEALQGDWMLFPYVVSIYINAMQYSSSWLDEFSYFLSWCVIVFWVDFLNFFFSFFFEQ